jgi:serine/threonine protein kinase/tetratricopeptide (TPR) repeat protein
MDTARICRRDDCKTALAEGSSDNLCPKCLMEELASTADDRDSDEESWESLAYREHGLEVIRKIAEGGEGEIYAAVQTAVERDVALKILKPGVGSRFGGSERFLEGARIGGRLQHPGIVPVYELGWIKDRPFLTMRLIATGHSLAEILASREVPSRGELIGIYVHVCQTMAYAHEQGIVHLDLSPSNVMIGDHGEVLVIDWGLARERESWSGPGLGVGGTPSYASPEQLSGEADRLDPRCDVFALGAILCEILTSRPPYIVASREVRRSQLESDLADAAARLDASGADPALTDLSRACLALDPARRPRDAGMVAARIREYQASEQKRYEDSQRARGKAEERARWILRSMLAALMVVVGLAIVWNQSRVARARTEAEGTRAVEELLTSAKLDLSRGKIPDAQTAAELATQRLGDVTRTRQEAFRKRISDVRMLARLWKIRHPDSPEEWAARKQAPQVAAGYAAAFRDYGVDVSQSGTAADRIRGSEIASQLVIAFDDWAQATRDVALPDTLLAIADRADPEPNGPLGKIRRAKRERNVAALKELAASEEVRELPPQILASLSIWLRNANALAEAITLLRDAWMRHPEDYSINLELGTDLFLAAKTPEAEAEANGYRIGALALSRRSPLFDLYLGVNLYEMGMAERSKPRFERAAASYARAIEIDPSYAAAWCNRGNALTALGNLPEAVASLREALRLQPSYALAHFNLGVAFDAQKKYEAAIDSYREAIRCRESYAEAYMNLAGDEYNLGWFAQADEDYKKGFDRLPPSEPLRPLLMKLWELTRSLAEVDPKLAAVRAGSARSANASEALNLARLCVHPKRLDQALAAKLFHEAFEKDPDLGKDPIMGDRYAAAAAAVVAATLPATADKERVELRRWALEWLRSELTIREGTLLGNDARAKVDSRSKLNFWTRDPSFAPVRGQALDLLPADERTGWADLWNQVRKLLDSSTPAR